MQPLDADATLVSGLPPLEAKRGRLLALTVLWHPETGRVGEQFIAAPGIDVLAVDRFAPLFCQPGQQQRSLGERSIARDGVRLTCDRAGGLTIRAPASVMPVGIDGKLVPPGATVHFPRIDSGVVLQLGGAVLLCVHWVDSLARAGQAGMLVGISNAMDKVRELIRQVAGTELPVLLLGESGTGKELAARMIHTASKRAAGPLVAVNMAALNDALAAAELFGAARGAYTGAERSRAGLFAEAAEGTLFLDEIGNSPAVVQPMLLRVLDGGHYRPLGAERDVCSRARLIAATDQSLESGQFNQPLLRRLEGFVIRLPALRDRREDIGLLIAHIAQAWMPGAAATLPSDLVREMCCYDWPGNVRQLGNVVRRALLAIHAGQSPSLQELAPVLADRRELPAVPAAQEQARRPDLSSIDGSAVVAAMDRSGWQINGAAQALGISRPSMYKLLAAHPQIRAAEAIAADELRRTLDASGGDVERCAAALRTPAEALRRHLRSQGLIG